jgi:hypothetical protein
MNKIICCLVTLGLILACNSNNNSSQVKTNDMDTSVKKEWINHTNIYEVNVRQYTPQGTFNAFAKELTRLKEMGNPPMKKPEPLFLMLHEMHLQ